MITRHPINPLINLRLKLGELNFSNRLFKHCDFVFTKVKSTPLTNPIILHLNLDLLSRLNIDVNESQKSSFKRFLNGDLEFEGLLVASTCYSGHQFGYYVSQLGDGRALMLGEIKNHADEFFELQLKGSGPTPFSRMGDGKAVVRSSIREYLASAHLKALKIPTTEALAISYGSGEVYREEVEKEAIVCRVAESFLRFGHFQYFAHTKQDQKLKNLIDYTIEHYFTEFSDHPNKYNLFFQSVAKSTAKLFASWQAIGFCHGVLNTDNMSILGLTIDYGPFGFIDSLDLDFICNHSDHEGRYSFGNQPPIGLWNLEQLGIALNAFISNDDMKIILNSYSQIFHFEYRRLLKEKMGLYKMLESDEEFLRSTLNMLVATKIDYTQFFRSLCFYQTTKKCEFNLSEDLQRLLSKFLSEYDSRLEYEESSPLEREQKMLTINPKYILRNYIAQIAIENYQTNPELFNKIYQVLAEPFSEWSECEEWSKPAPSQYKNLSVSCSS